MLIDSKVVRDRFLAVAELPANERTAYLAAHCADDANLRAAVERLLAAHEQPASVLNRPIPESQGQTQVFVHSEQPGTVIAGRYKLLQQIGEGGMGSVWMADQTEPVKRRIAVKLIRVDRGNSKMILSRFEAERQAIALMDHPHIARLLDAGTTDAGQPYFVMELVKGIPLTDYCDAQKLSILDRLTLFQQICSAVQHAHQKGIIHRDLKPSNILVESHDGKPVPKVIDFGLAKATSGMKLTDHTLFTAFGNVMGTPTYMAPEQAAFNAVDVDTRADVYSLGVILYELLTGTTPITRETVKKAALDEMLKLIREQEAPKPSSRLSNAGSMPGIAANRNIDPTKLSKLLQGDLDWVVLKALEKDRNRRYETANGFAADIQRHISNEPVVARPPSTLYRFQKAWQRNRLAFAASTAIVASLVIGIAASVWQAVRADREATRAVAALDELRETAPAFVEQSRALVAKEQFDEALEKLAYAAKLRPEAPEYLVAKGDVLQCQFRLAEAAEAYRASLVLRPDDARAQASAALCDELLAAPPGPDGKLTRESLSKLHGAMQQQQRSAAELMPVARRLGEEKTLIAAYWLARLKDLPISPDNPLEKRLSIRDDGLLALDLSDTKIADLVLLNGMPLGSLYLDGCKQIADFAPLGGFRSLTVLDLGNTEIEDLTSLRGLSLDDLDLKDTRIFDLATLRGMKLKRLSLRNTRVADLSPLAGMPLTFIDATSIPATDYSPLAGAPLEMCIIQSSPLRDLSFLQNSPVKELSLFSCNEARGFAVLAGLKSLDLLILPQSFRGLPEEDLAAIEALRTHPTLRNIQTENRSGTWQIGTTQSKDDFWKDWDLEQTFVPALRKGGLAFSLSKLSTGTYSVSANNQPISDLSMLKGAPISDLWVGECNVTDLAPIHDLPLRVLGLYSNPELEDLSPLRGMPLEELSIEYTKVSDLSPLSGLPLKKLYLHGCENLTDLSPLAEIPTLEKLTIPIRARNIEVLRQLPNLKWLDFQLDSKNADFPASTPEEFWKDFAANYAWLTRLQDAGFKIKKQNRLDDGTWELDLENAPISDLKILSGAPISKLWLSSTPVSDLTPLRGMPLTMLGLYDTKVTDLAPLEGMRLILLNLVSTKVTDLSVLRGMPLVSLKLNNCTELSDLSPLVDSTTLTELTLPPNAKDVTFLRDFSQLERLSYTEDAKNSYRPDKTAAEFWKEFDATKK